MQTTVYHCDICNAEIDTSESPPEYEARLRPVTFRLSIVVEDDSTEAPDVCPACWKKAAQSLELLPLAPTNC